MTRKKITSGSNLRSNVRPSFCALKWMLLWLYFLDCKYNVQFWHWSPYKSIVILTNYLYLLLLLFISFVCWSCNVSLIFRLVFLIINNYCVLFIKKWNKCKQKKIVPLLLWQVSGSCVEICFSQSWSLVAKYEMGESWSKELRKAVGGRGECESGQQQQQIWVVQSQQAPWAWLQYDII